MSNFSKNIVALRKAKKLTQKQVAMAVGVDEETYQKLEFEMEEPNLQTLTRLAGFYEVDAVDLKNGHLNITAPVKETFGEVKRFVNDTTSDDLRSARSTKSGNISPKSRAVTACLAYFLGVFGAHNFYLQKTGRGIAQLVLSLLCIGLVITAVWAFIEFVMALCGSLTDSDGKEVKKW